MVFSWVGMYGGMSTGVAGRKGQDSGTKRTNNLKSCWARVVFEELD